MPLDLFACTFIASFQTVLGTLFGSKYVRLKIGWFLPRRTEIAKLVSQLVDAYFYYCFYLGSVRTPLCQLCSSAREA